MDDILVALRAIVALGAVLGLLLFLSRRLQKSQAKGVSPVSYTHLTLPTTPYV